MRISIPTSTLFLPLALILGACQANSSNQKEESEITPHGTSEVTWLGTLHMNDSTDLPFHFDWDKEHQNITIENADERIFVDSTYTIGDSIAFVMPVFQSELHVLMGDDTWNGYWTKTDAKNYWMPFTAKDQSIGAPDRFTQVEANNNTPLPGRWEVELRTGTDNPKPAIGEFSVNEFGNVKGSFITETGDYRFLSGEFDGNRLVLSAFDGMHAYLFEAEYINGELRGTHYSGLTYAQHWKATPSEDFQLRDPKELTFLKEGYTTVSFGAQALNGDSFMFNGENIKGPTIIQIMGSWCPNCMDETRYFTELYQDYHKDGLSVVGITFETRTKLEDALPAIERMVADLDIPYNIVFGGQARSESIASTLPMIDNFMSYPTSIFLDKEGRVREIHTGFSGPGTSIYEQYTFETEALIETMLNE